MTRSRKTDYFPFFCLGCGGDLVMESGAFNSPNYPDAYPPNLECVWTIKSSPGNRLQLSFMLVNLNLMGHSWNNICDELF